MHESSSNPFPATAFPESWSEWALFSPFCPSLELRTAHPPPGRQRSLLWSSFADRDVNPGIIRVGVGWLRAAALSAELSGTEERAVHLKPPREDTAFTSITYSFVSFLVLCSLVSFPPRPCLTLSGSRMTCSRGKQHRFTWASGHFIFNPVKHLLCSDF